MISGGFFVDRRDFYYSDDEQNNLYINPEEYRKMRYYKNYQSYENYPQDYTQNENEEPVHEKKPIAHPILIFQVVVCLLAAIAVFTIKSIGGDLYDTVKKYYSQFINTPDVITDFISENQLNMTQQENTENTSQPTEETTQETSETETASGDENE